MKYEPLWERFEAIAPDGTRCAVQFLRAGFLTLGDRPELYFFRVIRAADASENAAEEIAVGLSGDALKRFEKTRRRLSREEKIDLTGLLLKKNMEAGKGLDSKNMFIRDEELASLASELGIPR
ncbi:MAG: hypothetical protein DMG31_16345 [Acidobacteria bacterium]|nr:MAG: hypothetical protein DMG31_16345 [Acidobacteriota bacterium]